VKKVCQCCHKVHVKIPANARPDNQFGVTTAMVWECDCKSTMYYFLMPLEQIKALIKKGEAA
jgi:hypothetical protein